MSRIQKFDYGRATELQSKLANEIHEIEATLGKTKTMVDSCQEWWKGGSEKAFIEDFDETKKEAVKALNEWLKGLQEVIKQTSEIYQKNDEQLAAAIRKR